MLHVTPTDQSTINTLLAIACDIANDNIQIITRQGNATDSHVSLSFDFEGTPSFDTNGALKNLNDDKIFHQIIYETDGVTFQEKIDHASRVGFQISGFSCYTHEQDSNTAAIGYGALLTLPRIMDIKSSDIKTIVEDLIVHDHPSDLGGKMSAYLKMKNYIQQLEEKLSDG